MSITVIPAIDLIGGKCVRLQQGDYNKRTVYQDDPVATARQFEEMGFTRLHLVDLEGAKGSPGKHLHILERICQATRLHVDFSGGLKSRESIQSAFDAGAEWVCLGSIAQQQPELTREWLQIFGPRRIILGADVKDGWIHINGWQTRTDTCIDEFIENYLPDLHYLLCTDINRDGMLGGTAVELYEELQNRYPTLSVIASGGVRSREDIDALERIGISSVVVGKAFYENRL